MQVLGTNRPLLLWGAERPFQLQLLAGLGRLGMDVFALTNGGEGKKLVDTLHPKNSDSLEIPESFEGNVIWAPQNELFFNSELTEESKQELSNVLILCEFNPRIEKCFVLLPQNAFKYVEDTHLEKSLSSKAQFLYFPALLSFGDKNILDGFFDQLLDSGLRGDALDGEFLSIFDAVSMTLGFVKLKENQKKLWAKGVDISKDAIEKGFEEAAKAGALGALQNLFKRATGRRTQFSYQTAKLPEDIPLALDLFPTVLTPWDRFFRDSYRIYQQTQDSGLLLHFRPTKSP